jgi:hypothetical protein
VDEFLEIRRLFDEFEKSVDPKDRIEKFKAGLACTNEYLEGVDTAGPDAKKVKNLKRSYTRILVASLSALTAITFDLWMEYFMVLFTEVLAEVQEILQLHPALQQGYDDFIRLHIEELRQSYNLWRSGGRT